MKVIAPIMVSICFGICMMSGCRSYYQETGTAITAGDVLAPAEVSDASDIITIRALFSMSGMRLWSSRGNSVSFVYDHAYTNSYLFGLVDTKGRQRGTVAVVATNQVPGCTDVKSQGVR